MRRRNGGEEGVGHMDVFQEEVRVTAKAPRPGLIRASVGTSLTSSPRNQFDRCLLEGPPNERERDAELGFDG